MSDLRKAAQALVVRWDTPAWKDAPHTGQYIDELRAALAQPEQEPVAWMSTNKTWMWSNKDKIPDRWAGNVIPLYANPPQRKPLTEAQIAAIDWKDGETLHDFARAIEAAHGIGEK